LIVLAAAAVSHETTEEAASLAGCRGL
jgi:hypothetical protein